MTQRSAPPLALGVDAGGSSTRWVLRGPDGEVARGEVGSLSGLSFLTGTAGSASGMAPGVAAPTAQRFVELAGSVGRHAAAWARRHDVPDAAEEGADSGASTIPLAASLRAVVAGVTGLTRGDAAAEQVRDGLAAALGVDAARVEVLDDVTLVYRSVFDPGEGIAVYAGTGSMAAHETRGGALIRAGGHGYLIDDAGGGYWIGRRALRAALRSADANGAPAEGPLADAVYAALGSAAWPEIRRRVYQGGRREVAALVPAVGAAAEAGDPQAAAIIEEAGKELARLVGTLSTRLGAALPVALAGGVVGVGPRLTRAVAAALPMGAELHEVRVAPVEAAAHMAAAAPRGAT